RLARRGGVGRGVRAGEHRWNVSRHCGRGGYHRRGHLAAADRGGGAGCGPEPDPRRDGRHRPRALCRDVGGSKTTYTVGTAVKLAAEDARKQVLTIAASEMEARAEDLEIVDGFVRVKGTPQRALPLGDILKKSMAFGARYAPVFGNGSIPS